jgi:hypothetical protein
MMRVLPAQHRLDRRLQLVPVPPLKFNRRSRDTPPYAAAMPGTDLSDNRNKRLTFPGSGFAGRSVRTSVRLEAQRQPSENERAGAWYQGRAIAETATKLDG